MDMAQGRLKQIERSDVRADPGDRLVGRRALARLRRLHVARRSAIFVYDTVSGRTRQVTRPDFRRRRPVIRSRREVPLLRLVAGVRPRLRRALLRLRVPARREAHLVTLRANEPSPFSATQRQPRAPGQPAGPGEGVRTSPTPASQVRVSAASTKEPTTPVRRDRLRRDRGPGRRLSRCPRGATAAVLGGKGPRPVHLVSGGGDAWRNRPPTAHLSQKARSRPGTSPRRRSSPSWRACST